MEKRFNRRVLNKTAAGPGPASTSKEKKTRRKNGDPSSTNVFITINTNLKPPKEEDAEEAERALLIVMEQMTEGPAGYDAVSSWYTEGGYKRGKELPSASFSDHNLVQSVDTEFVVERQGNKGSIHSHAVVRVKHTGTLFFERLKIKQFVLQRYNRVAPMHVQMRSFPNVQIRLLGNPKEGQALKSYLLKELAPEAADKGVVQEAHVT